MGEHRRKWSAVKWLLAICFGALSTVALAWWITLTPQRLVPFPAAFGMKRSMTVNRFIEDEDPNRVRFWTTSRGFGARSVSAFNLPRDEINSNHGFIGRFDAASSLPVPIWADIPELNYENRIVGVNVYGWPIPCLRAVGFKPAGTPRGVNVWHEREAISVRPDLIEFLQAYHVPLPIRILPARFIASVMIHGIAWRFLMKLLCLAPRSLVAHRRRLTNRCTACGYSLDSLTADTCPECGRAFRLRSQDDRANSAETPAKAGSF